MSELKAVWGHFKWWVFFMTHTHTCSTGWFRLRNVTKVREHKMRSLHHPHVFWRGYSGARTCLNVGLKDGKTVCVFFFCTVHPQVQTQTHTHSRAEVVERKFTTVTLPKWQLIGCERTHLRLYWLSENQNKPGSPAYGQRHNVIVQSSQRAGAPPISLCSHEPSLFRQPTDWRTLQARLQKLNSAATLRQKKRITVQFSTSHLNAEGCFWMVMDLSPSL